MRPGTYQRPVLDKSRGLPHPGIWVSPPLVTTRYIRPSTNKNVFMWPKRFFPVHRHVASLIGVCATSDTHFDQDRIDIFCCLSSLHGCTNLLTFIYRYTRRLYYICIPIVFMEFCLSTSTFRSQPFHRGCRWHHQCECAIFGIIGYPLTLTLNFFDNLNAEGSVGLTFDLRKSQLGLSSLIQLTMNLYFYSACLSVVWLSSIGKVQKRLILVNVGLCALNSGSRCQLSCPDFYPNVHVLQFCV